MKVTFVYPDLSLKSQGKFYHGPAFLSAVLKQADHRTSLIHITKPITDEKFLSLISQEKPDLIAFSTTTNMFKAARRYAKLAKNNTEVPIIFGGIHPTIVPEEVISCPEIDMVCVGEGEYALLELCNKMSESKEICSIHNIWVKEDGKIHRNPLRPVIQDLDELPFPDRNIYDYASLEDAKLNRAVFMASRGCPYNCSYCCNHKLKEINSGQYVRFRSVDNIIQEIQLVTREHPVKSVTFHDDILTLKKEWLREFSQEYRQKINLPFICNSRANLLDREIVSLLKSAGCHGINMGIESGNDYIRQKVLNRNITKQQIVRAFGLCKEYNIPVASYNMVGLPFEDLEKIIDTIKLNAQIRPGSMQVSIFFPYPGTKIYEACLKNNFMSDIEVNSYFERTILLQPSISGKKVEFAFRSFKFMVWLYFYLDKLPKGIAKVIERNLEKMFLSANSILSIGAKIFLFCTDVKYYANTIRKYYKEYGLSYVIRKAVKKISKSA
jgi:anaerobic magnesium-protoporphyrin IX monomethyl ester cyclase